jgi:hypothetical protein
MARRTWRGKFAELDAENVRGLEPDPFAVVIHQANSGSKKMYKSPIVLVSLLILSLPAAVVAQNPEGAAKGCVDLPLAQQTEPPAPPRDKAAGKSGTTGWSGSLGGTNVATEGGGTRDPKQRVPETAQGLDPTAKGKAERQGAPC